MSHDDGCLIGCYWTCFDYARRFLRGGWGEKKKVTEAVRKKNKQKGLCDARSMLLRIDPSRPFTKDYKTQNFVGQGSFGSVFEVKHRRTGESRVSKEILMRDIDDMEYAQIELEAMIRLDHPNVLKLYEYFEDNVAVYLICEFCRGGDFSQLGEPGVDIDEIRWLFRDVVAALAYCHAENVAHRDLKMENCLIDVKPNRRNVGKVIDFGLAGIKRSNVGDAWMNEILGTRYYVAPEIIDKRILYNFKCDVWAVGVMLYITITDEHPCAKNGFNLKTPALWKRIVSKEPISLQPLKDKGAGKSLKNLLCGLLEKDMNHRPSAEEVLGYDWFKTLSTGENIRGSWSAPMSPTRGSTKGDIRGSTCSDKSISSEAVMAIHARAITYRQASKFEKAILTIASYQETSEEIENLRSIFIEMDTAGNGTLSQKELEAGFQKAGMEMSRADMSSLFRALDADKTGKVHFTEWLAGTTQPSEIASDKAISDVFDFFDIDRNGKVNRDEICQVLGDEASADSFLQAAEVGDRSYLTKTDMAKVMKAVATSMDARNRRFSSSARLLS